MRLQLLQRPVVGHADRIGALTHTLADLGEAQPAFQAFGIAGLVVAYANLDELEQAAFENSRLTPDMRALLREKSPLMADLLDTTLDQLF